MSISSSLARYGPSEPILRLDLGRQRLLIEPDDPLPKFYPRPKAVMVIPIYDDTDVLVGPTVIDSSVKSQGGDPRYGSYGFNGHPGSSSHPTQQQQQQKPYGQEVYPARPPLRPTNKLRRRYSSYSPPPQIGESDDRSSSYASVSPRSARRPQANGHHSHSHSRNDNDSHSQRHSVKDKRHSSHGHGSYYSHHALVTPDRHHHQQQPQSDYLTANGSQHDDRVQQSHYGSGGGRSSPNSPSRGSFLHDMKERHAAFHAAIREYCKVMPPNPKWCASNCTGRKKAVCIGINYIGQRSELKGCANDARAMREFLIQQYGFPASDIVLLTDDDRNNKMPTRAEMFRAFEWLVNGAKKHDSLFFHYSGHGGQVPDKPGGREIDGMDEDIFPVDFKETGDIIDDDLHKALVDPLPAGCRLTAIFDSCHSGTVLDLPYIHSAHGRLRSVSHISHRARGRGVSEVADVICFSACTDDETAADTFSGDVAVGAMSYALLRSLENNRTQTYDVLLQHLREILIPKYQQKAQISCTHPLELERQFTL